jgi:hypothetical protein
MQSRLYHRLIRRIRWRHLAAFLLLGIASFDITVIDMISPQLCGDEASAIPVENADGKSDQNVAVKATIIDQDSLPQQDSSETSTEDECFCCCSHVLPRPVVNHVTLNKMPRINIALIETLPSPPPQDTFHPPRLA